MNYALLITGLSGMFLWSWMIHVLLDLHEEGRYRRAKVAARLQDIKIRYGR